MSTPAPRLVTWENGTDLVIEMPLSVAPDATWAALTDGTRASEWFAPFTVDGDTVTLELEGTESADSALVGEILSCEADEHVLVEFPDFGVLGIQLLPVEVVPDLPVEAGPEAAAVSAMGVVPAGTVLVFTQSAADEERARRAAAQFGPMWDTHLRMFARTLGLDVPEASEDDLEAVYADLDLEVDDEAEDALGDDDLGDDGGPR